MRLLLTKTVLVTKSKSWLTILGRWCLKWLSLNRLKIKVRLWCLVSKWTCNCRFESFWLLSKASLRSLKTGGSYLLKWIWLSTWKCITSILSERIWWTKLISCSRFRSLKCVEALATWCRLWISKCVKPLTDLVSLKWILFLASLIFISSNHEYIWSWNTSLSEERVSSWFLIE